ncbi:hypothetical protein [Nesterenkonia alba]|uniref:hypothetical protein n=1 Tax=Nesterenkonia alba TaxID=515814 RepID=UPI001FE0D9A7|nr:hypothetical protein [Nesterenkonia alba]
MPAPERALSHTPLTACVAEDELDDDPEEDEPEDEPDEEEPDEPELEPPSLPWDEPEETRWR